MYRMNGELLRGGEVQPSHIGPDSPLKEQKDRDWATFGQPKTTGTKASVEVPQAEVTQRITASSSLTDTQAWPMPLS